MTTESKEREALPELPKPATTARELVGIGEANFYTDDQMHAYARAALNQERQPPAPWVSVDERLPPLNTEVLVAFDRVAIPSTAQLAQCGGLRQWLWPKENDDFDRALAVTHWMPLPEHPNVGPDGNFIVDPFDKEQS